MSNSIIFHFTKYTIANVGCFVIDLILLFILTEIFLLPTVPSIIFSFLLTSLILYISCYTYVFSSSPNRMKRSFSVFWIFVFVKLAIALVIINYILAYLSITATLARLASGLIEAVLAFFWDYYFSFSMNKKQANLP